MKEYIGLNENEAAASREQYGENRLEGKKRSSFFEKLFHNFNDPIIRVLLIALVFNILFTIRNINITECLGIVLAITVSTVVSTLSETGSEKAFEKLSRESEGKTCRAFRAGRQVILPIDRIVVGDILMLGMGESVPADGSLLDGELLVNQAALTGESKEKKKRPSKSEALKTPEAENRVFRGSLITRGSAVIRVEAVGQNTFLGGVAKDLTEDTRQSPMKLRLTKLAGTISKIGYCLAVLVALSYLFGTICLDTGFDREAMLLIVRDYRMLLSHVIRALTLAVTVIVVAVPEGLPMMISVVLSSNMKRMLKDQILVKKPVGIETAGSLNLLFSDKTGTFTTGMHHVSGFVFADGRFIKELSSLKKGVGYAYLVNTARYNTECRLVEGKAEGSNASDRAITEYFASEGSGIGQTLGGIPFDSRYKYSAAKTPEGDVLIKGAPEVLMPYLTKAIDKDGKSISCDKKELQRLLKTYTDRACRLLMIAVCDRLPNALGFAPLTFVAFAVIEDPLRESTAKSLQVLKKAGIQVVMVTGDSPDTARAVAKAAGLFDQNREGLILTSEELAALDDEALASALPRLSVVARALPQDKTRLVRVAQSQDLVVGMTGDGVNDAPALKLADVGFAMGSGTDIAKEAGDIVILDNDMAAMVKAVLYGRTIFKSIRKFIIFQLTMNFCAVGVTLIGPLFAIPSPITVVQMLWINMIMDTLGGLAFAGEAPEKHTLEEVPKTRREGLLSRGAFGKILFNGLTALTLCTLFMAVDFFKNALGFYEEALVYYSAFFSLFIFMGVVMFYIARSDRLNFTAGLLNNTSFLLITFLVTAVQLLMVYFGGSIFRTVPLSPKILCGVAILSTVLLPLDLLRRAVMKRK